MRAELVAIYAVLQHPNNTSKKCTIATDSKAAMQAIHKQIHNPIGNKSNTHEVLFKAIAASLLQRAHQGLETTIIKVSSHIGIGGNQIVDKLANDARDPQAFTITCSVGNLAHQGEHWPLLITPSKEQENQTVDRTAGNLKQALKVHIASRHAKGLTNQGSYLELWNDIQHELHKSSQTFWKAPHKVIRNVIRARFGGLYNQKSACRFRHAHDDSCPLCGLPDSAGHMLGECMHKDMKSLAIERHNAAGRIVAQAIQHGALGNCVMIGDVGNAEKCNALNLHSTRVPEWLLSDDDLLRANTNCTVARPDLMLVTITHEEAQALSDRRKRDRNGYRTRMLSSRPDAHAIMVLIVEVGYSSELRYKEKLQVRLDQHKQLVQAMENAGYQCNILPVVLGTTGGVFKE